jgi:hypothetical protein
MKGSSNPRHPSVQGDSPSSSRPPDFRLAIMDKSTGQKNYRAGGAWVDADTGHIRIILDYGITIPSGPNVMITLFPNDRQQEPR